MEIKSKEKKLVTTKGQCTVDRKVANKKSNFKFIKDGKDKKLFIVSFEKWSRE